jgi:nucleoside 2-deoxyribosyltransferase
VRTLNALLIMPFAEEFYSSYEAIAYAAGQIRSPVKVDARRLDEHKGAGTITKQLVDRLRDSDLCIADISGTERSGQGPNPNVMWELGYADAMGKPCIIVCRERTEKGDPSEIPFDLAVEKVHRYDPARLEGLRETIRDALRDTIRAAQLDQPKVADFSYDEVGHLAALLRVEDVRDTSLLTILHQAVRGPGGYIQDWNFADATKLMRVVEEIAPRDRNDVFWWLIVHGVLRYSQIRSFQNDQSNAWSENVDLVTIHPRGVRLLNRLRTMESI